jgi:hypothetical protein
MLVLHSDKLTPCIHSPIGRIEDLVRLSGSPARVGPTTPTRAPAGAREEPTGSTPNLAFLRQPKATVANPAYGSSLDRNEEHDSGLCLSLVERDKGEDCFVRLGLEETKE